jgi:hypothetical protein
MDQLRIKVGLHQQETYRQPRFLMILPKLQTRFPLNISLITQKNITFTYSSYFYEHSSLSGDVSIESSDNWRFYSNEFESSSTATGAEAT